LKPEGEKTVLVAAPTRKGYFGAAAFARQRFRPHLNPKWLEVLHLARTIFNETLITYARQPDMTFCMRKAVTKILEKRHAEKYLKKKQQSVARRINFGLANSGARP
jgi:hypothetical protein